MASKALIGLVGVALLAGGWFWLGAEETWPITNAPADGQAVDAGKPIVALGDSITAGYNMAPGQSYPAKLSAMLGREVINAGVSGNTSIDAVNRFEKDVLSLKPGVVIIGLGGNDILRKVDHGETFANLQRIVDACQKQGAVVMILGFSFPLKGSYARSYRELAKAKGCVYLDDSLSGIFGNRDHMIDAVHPNAKGYAILAERIAAKLRGYVGDATD